MAINREELKKQVMNAASAEEIMEIIKAAGEEITAEQAAQLFEKAQKRKEDRELSVDELESVSGGDDYRDWPTEGCAASVEDGSWCWSNDWCYVEDVTYKHMIGYCSRCAKSYFDHIGFDAEQRRIYRCPNCGRTITVEAVEYNSTH